MENPRPEKVAIVDEVKQNFSSSNAVVLTEYRGLDVDAMGDLRRALREAGGHYKIYKNTMVRFAVSELELDIADLLTGPTAIAFVTRTTDGEPGDTVTVAKTLKNFAKDHPSLVIKGGLLGEKFLAPEDISRLADVAPREELLARFAGGLAAPMQRFAGLLQAVPRNFAYGLAALIAQGGAAGEATEAESTASEATEAPETAEAESTAGDAAEAESTVGDAAEAPAGAASEASAVAEGQAGEATEEPSGRSDTAPAEAASDAGAVAEGQAGEATEEPSGRSNTAPAGAASDAGAVAEGEAEDSDEGADEASSVTAGEATEEPSGRNKTDTDPDESQ